MRIQNQQGGFQNGSGDFKGNSKKHKKSNTLEKEEPCPVGVCFVMCSVVKKSKSSETIVLFNYNNNNNKV